MYETQHAINFKPPYTSLHWLYCFQEPEPEFWAAVVWHWSLRGQQRVDGGRQSDRDGQLLLRGACPLFHVRQQNEFRVEQYVRFSCTFCIQADGSNIRNAFFRKLIILYILNLLLKLKDFNINYIHIFSLFIDMNVSDSFAIFAG